MLIWCLRGHCINVQVVQSLHVQTPSVHLKVNIYSTADHVAKAKLHCGSYCNVSVSSTNLNGIKALTKGSINTVGMWQALQLCIYVL